MARCILLLKRMVKKKSSWAASPNIGMQMRKSKNKQKRRRIDKEIKSGEKRQKEGVLGGKIKQKNGKR